MAEIITITANWNTGSLSSTIISRQYDNNRYRVQFMGYPEDASEDLIFYLLVWMRTDEAPQGTMLSPIQMDSDQWLISNYFTQLEQQIKFQLCIQNESGTFEAHSPIFNGSIQDSLEHDGEDIDIDTSSLFDYYREYVNNLIIQSGAVVVDSALSSTSQNPVQNKVINAALTELNGRLDQLDGGLTADVKAALLACFAHVAWDSDDPTGQSYISALQTALYPPANLSSISAVYTQSGTVWTTDTLDSLKTNLVVTAHYSDSTSEVLASSAYTLSGTLTEGTRTITVGYGGKTATFNVIVTRYDSSVYSWDFTSGITDSKQNVQATLGSGVTQNSSGLTFDGTTNGYVYLANLSAYATSAFTIEIDVTTIPETAYAFLVNLNQQADLGANATGLCFDGTKWWFKTSANANVSIASDTLTDETIFNGKTLKVQIDYANSTMSLYNDGTLLGTATIYNKSNGRDYLGIGSSKSTQLTVAAGTVITAVRVYEGVV